MHMVHIFKNVLFPKATDFVKVRKMELWLMKNSGNITFWNCWEEPLSLQVTLPAITNIAL